MTEHEPEVKIANLLAEFRMTVAAIRRHGATEEQCLAFFDRHFGLVLPGTMEAKVHDRARKITAEVFRAPARSGV